MPTVHTKALMESENNNFESEEENNNNNNNNNTNMSNSNTKKKLGKKTRLLSLPTFKSPFKFSGKTLCRVCHKKCSGRVLKVKNSYFHNDCFTCFGCKISLSQQGGFFPSPNNEGKNGDGNGDKDDNHYNYYCGPCFQSSFGTKCASCNNYVEGEIVTALGKTYHQLCFKCDDCRVTFPPGDKVTFNGSRCLCTTCLYSSDKTLESCAGCQGELKEGEALLALNKQYHVWCFKCTTCGIALHGEYMGQDGVPYCEKDYQLQFGVQCSYCSRFISGKVLQAGDANHFHPSCARCTKCGEPFGDGEEMFLQGAAIWHPRCGPGPTDPPTLRSRNEKENEEENFTFTSRASSPMGRSSISALMMSGEPWRSGRLYNSSSTYSLRRPMEPGDGNNGSSTHLGHFHLPPSRTHRRSGRTSTVSSLDCIPNSIYRPLSAPPKPGYTQRSITLRPRSRQPVNNNNDYSDSLSQSSFRPEDYRIGYRYSGSLTQNSPPIKDHKVYPYHLIMTSNYKMPPEVDRCNLEKHLTDEDFEMVFNCSRHQFYSLPQWRRHDLKRRARLF